MATKLQITKKLQITPLVDLCSAEFAEGYTDGLYSCLFGEHAGTGPREDRYFVEAFHTYMKNSLFDGRHEGSLYSTLGFHLGLIHGGVLSRNGQLLKGTTTLVTLDDQDIARGYKAGRDYFFLDATTDAEWYCTDQRLVERLRELVIEYASYRDPDSVVLFAIGSVYGELSGHLFPWTVQEQRRWEQESIQILGYVCSFSPQCLAAQMSILRAVS